MSIERRKAVGTEQPQQEVDIADVLQHLNLDISPGEIFTEVARQRQKHVKASRAKRRAVLGALAALAVLLGGVSFVSNSLSAPEQTTPTYSLTWPDVQKQVLAQDTAPSGPFLRTLAEVPDGRMVTVTADAVYSAVSDEWPTTGQTRPIDNTVSEMRWRVCKVGKDLYLRGWTAERLSPQAAKLGSVSVYDTPTAPGLGPSPIQIGVWLTPGSVFSPFTTLPCERPLGQPWECFNVHSVQSDEHTWEKW